MFKMPMFPEGTRFYGAESGDIPVAVVRVPAGWQYVRYDTNPPCSHGQSMMEAVEITKEEFEVLVQKFHSPEYIKQHEAQKAARKAEWEKRLAKFSPEEKAARIKAALARCEREKQEERDRL